MPYTCDTHGDHGAYVVLTLLHSGDVLALCEEAFAQWCGGYMVTIAQDNNLHPAEFFGLLAAQAREQFGPAPGDTPPTTARRKAARKRKGASEDDSPPADTATQPGPGQMAGDRDAAGGGVPDAAPGAH